MTTRVTLGQGNGTEGELKLAKAVVFLGFMYGWRSGWNDGWCEGWDMDSYKAM